MIPTEGAAVSALPEAPGLPTRDHASPVAMRLLDAIVRCDRAALATVLAPDVWFRALLVHDVIEQHTAAAAIETIDGWFANARALHVLWADAYPVASREHITYRLRLRPDWAPDTWHLIEQSGYIRVHRGRVRRIDLGCTGFVPQ
jgi:hypothetical protein